MNYQNALEHLYTLNQKGIIKTPLEHIQKQLAALNHPEQQFRSIHIAGTNGKGSVSFKIAKSLELVGYKVGLFTSPHISTFRERIQINGTLISESDVVLLLNKIPKTLTFFETTTLLAYRYFAKEKVDFAVIETGLGGRFDATNTLNPELTIITSIALDHTEILGNSLDAIAFEKAGILKENVPLILGPRANLKVIHTVASQKKCLLTIVEGAFSTFDKENSAIAKASLKQLNISKEASDKGCALRPPCRLEIIQTTKFPVILDVAHNPDGLKALIDALRHDFPKQRFSFIVGLSNSKDTRECLKAIIGYAAFIYLVQGENPRASSKDALAKELDLLEFTNYSLSASIKEALDKTQTGTVISGSFFIMDEARKALGLDTLSDLHPKTIIG